MQDRCASSRPPRPRASLNPLWTLRDQAIAGITARYVSHPWPVNFLLIVDPLVTWIWIGAIIIACGGLIALWPFPRSRGAGGPCPSHGVRRAAPAPPPVREPVKRAGLARLPGRALMDFVVVLVVFARP